VRVTVFNRSEERGREVATAFAAGYGGPPEAVADAEPYDLLAHVTPVGFDDPEAMLLPVASLRPGTVVFDAVARPPQTRLLREAAAGGCQTIAGVRMQLHQAACQFELYTGRVPDLTVMERALAQVLSPATAEPTTASA
jgi:shikimate 5-dehydrogenase